MCVCVCSANTGRLRAIFPSGVARIRKHSRGIVALCGTSDKSTCWMSGGVSGEVGLCALGRRWFKVVFIFMSLKHKHALGMTFQHYVISDLFIFISLYWHCLMCLFFLYGFKQHSFFAKVSHEVCFFPQMCWYYALCVTFRGCGFKPHIQTEVEQEGNRSPEWKYLWRFMR